MLKETLILLGLVTIVLGQLPPEGKCVRGLYPGPGIEEVPSYIINLDLPPGQRWTQLAKDKKEEINNLVSVIKNTTSILFGDKLIKFVDETFPYLLETLPQPYADEISGIANATDLPPGELVLYNVFYELFTVCTSIIAKNEQGNLLHGRNLDFGLFLGWDFKNHTWALTEALRPTVINLEFQKGGKTIFRGASFGGYVGVLTAMKPSRFTLTIDERFNKNGGFVGLYQWLMGDRSQSWLGFLMRDVMEKAENYDEAQKTLITTKLLAPAYFILAGNQSDQAVVITKDRDSDKADVWTMEESGNKWFLVETNYDHWKNPPFFDDRRTSAVRCLNQLTQENATFSGLFDVLSSQPNLNKLTAYTCLMNANEDKIETYLQQCDDPCSPW